jgi:neopullulanase
MPIDTPAWVRDAVFYQIFPDRFARSGRVEAPGDLEPWASPPTEHGFKGGDLHGVVAHLDRLRLLGIDALYLNPILTSASIHRYHTDDYFHVDPLLGGDAAFRELLDEAYARDIRVVVDGVFNHCGRGFWPFHHVLENGAGSPYRDWFYLDEAVRAGERGLIAYPGAEEYAAMDALVASGVPRGAASRQVLGYEAWWDLPALPKLNLDEPRLRAFTLDAAEHWLRFGADGWRLDVPEEVSEDFWREFRSRVRSVKADAYIVGEVWHPLPEWLQGDMFDAFMNYPLALAILGFSAGHRLDRTLRVPEEYEGKLDVLDGPAFATRLMELDGLYDPAVTAVQLNLLGSHDTPRARTICGGDLDSMRLATLLQATLPGAPCIYYGDEIGMEGIMDPENRGGFPADPSAWEAEPHDWLADALALRHSSRALRDGELTMLGAEGGAVAYLRRHGPDVFAVVVNAADTPLAWDLPLPLDVSAVEVVRLRGGRGEPSAGLLSGSDGNQLHVEVAARDGAVVRLTPTA